jgi:hypothetical protein
MSKHGMEMFRIGQDMALVAQRPEEVGTKPPIGVREAIQ